LISRRRPLLAAALLGLIGFPSLAAPRRPKRSKPARHPPSAAAPAHGGRPGGYAQRADVLAWIDEQRREGPLSTWTRDELLAALAQAQYQPRVAQLILPPPVGVAKDWGAYRDRFIEPRRLQAGLRFWAANEQALARAEQQHGVPAALVMGIIGVETFYGQILGGFRALDALTTLGFDFPGGRSDRSAFFRGELAALLQLARTQGREPASFKGSYAGALGLGQFMPSSWMAYAQDFDGDGSIDLTASSVDAIGSVANFLREHGWQRGQPTHLRCEPPSDAAQRERLLAPDIEPRWSLDELLAAGMQPAEEQRELLQTHGPWALVRLENGGAEPTHLLGSRNFWVVTRYNRSAYYALAVIELGERLRQLREAGS
jgi:membrane-bound lytic murein transglycosylase B